MLLVRGCLCQETPSKLLTCFISWLLPLMIFVHIYEKHTFIDQCDASNMWFVSLILLLWLFGKLSCVTALSYQLFSDSSDKQNLVWLFIFIWMLKVKKKRKSPKCQMMEWFCCCEIQILHILNSVFFIIFFHYNSLCFKQFLCSKSLL